MMIYSNSPYIEVKMHGEDENGNPTSMSIDLNWQAKELLDILNLIYHELGYTRSGVQDNLREILAFVHNAKNWHYEFEKDLDDNPSLKASFESLLMIQALGKQKEKHD